MSQPPQAKKLSKKRRYTMAHYPDIKSLNNTQPYIAPMMSDFQSKKMLMTDNEDMIIEKLSNFNFNEAQFKS